MTGNRLWVDRHVRGVHAPSITAPVGVFQCAGGAVCLSPSYVNSEGMSGPLCSG